MRKRARCKPEELSRYNVAKKQAPNAVRKVMWNFEKKLAKDKSKNSKPFYAYLKGKRNSRTEWDHYETRTKTWKAVMKVWLESYTNLLQVYSAYEMV